LTINTVTEQWTEIQITVDNQFVEYIRMSPQDIFTLSSRQTFDGPWCQH